MPFQSTARPVLSRNGPYFLFIALVLLLALLAAAGSSELALPARAQSAEPKPGAATDPFPRQVTDAGGAIVKIAKPPTRIVSTDWALDEYLYALAEPQNVVGISENGHTERVSNVFSFVNRYHPVVADDAERIIRAKPDLVLTSSQQPGEFVALLAAAGIPVYRVNTEFVSLQQIERTTAVLGYVLGADRAAARTAARFTAGLYRAASHNNASAPRVLGLSGGFTYGANTIFDDVLKTVGAVNVAAEGGAKGYDTASPERIVQWNPDWIFTGADADKIESTRSKLLADPAIAATKAAKNNHVVVVDFHTFLPHSPLTAGLAELISDTVYGR